MRRSVREDKANPGGFHCSDLVGSELAVRKHETSSVSAISALDRSTRMYRKFRTPVVQRNVQLLGALPLPSTEGSLSGMFKIALYGCNQGAKLLHRLIARNVSFFDQFSCKKPFRIVQNDGHGARVIRKADSNVSHHRCRLREG